MTNEQMQALKMIERMRNEGKISPITAHSMNNAVGAGMDAFREQYPEQAALVPAPKSTVNKLKMPPPAQKEEAE